MLWKLCREQQAILGAESPPAVLACWLEIILVVGNILHRTRGVREENSSAQNFKFGKTSVMGISTLGSHAGGSVSRKRLVGEMILAQAFLKLNALAHYQTLP